MVSEDSGRLVRLLEVFDLFFRKLDIHSIYTESCLGTEAS